MFVWFVGVLLRVGLVRQGVCVFVGRVKGCGFDPSKTAWKHTSHCLFTTSGVMKKGQKRDGGFCVDYKQVVVRGYDQTESVCL